MLLVAAMLAALPITAFANLDVKAVYTASSSFAAGGKAAVDMLKTSSNVMDRGDIMADMYNAALEQNITVVWICSTNSSLDKKGESVTWKAEDAGKEFVCRV